MRNILVVHYSQSGQLTDIVKNFAKPFEQNQNCTVDYLNIAPVKEFDFPWSGYRFFDAFPESVNKTPCELKPFEIDETKEYDLIVLGYQVWYMAPSIPFNSFLLSETAKKVIKGKPVITILGSRNMWIASQEYVKSQVKSMGGTLIGNIVLRDKSENLTGIMSISYWMFSGKKKRMWGILPTPGVSEEDILHASRYGEITLNYMNRGGYDGLQDALLREDAVQVSGYLISLENRGQKIFKIWAKFMAKKGGPGDRSRSARVRMFAFYLPLVIVFLAPTVFIITGIVNLFRYKTIQKKKEYHLGVV